MNLKLLTVAAFIFYTVLVINYYYFKQNIHKLIISDQYSSMKPPIDKKIPDISCHLLKTPSLPNILDIHVDVDKSIFFIDTSCNSYSKGSIYINPRQACAVESAAILNPNRTIYLLYASPGEINIDSSLNSSKLLKNLVSYANIRILRIHIGDFVKNTPVENLWNDNRIFESIYPLAHVSDILRLLTLWKYGGIYLDTDVIVIKSLESIPLNFAGAESAAQMGNSVLSFSHNGPGHKYVEYSLRMIAKEFNGHQWAANGPILITKVIQHFCNTATLKIVNGTCAFRIYPINAFYPIPYPQWKKFFNEEQTEHVSNAITDSYIVHFWNKLSSKIPINANTQNVPYIQLAANYCSGTLMNTDEIF